MSTFAQKIAAQRKAFAEKNASYEKAYKFKVGKTYLRILPGVKNAEDFYRQYGAHYIKDPTTGSLVAVVGDAYHTYGKDCPVRNAIESIKREADARGDDVMSKAAKSWLAREVYVLNAQIIGGVDEENKNKVVRIEVSGRSLDDILNATSEILAADEAFDISKGFVLTCERQGTGATDTRYTFMPYMKQPTSAVPADVLAQRMDLDTYVDAKFGASVNKALVHLSNVLGRDVTTTALGSAMASTAASITDKSAYDEDFITKDSPPVAGAKKADAIDAEFDDLLGGDDVPSFDEPASKPAAKTAAKKEEKADEFADILADLETL